MDADTTAGREIFIHHLGPWTTEISLRYHFSSRYGPVESAYIIPGDSIGFVLFESQATASAVVRDSHQFIDGWPASCCLQSENPVRRDDSERKVIIWGFKLGLGTERFVEIFRQFGEIEVGPLGLDRETGELKPAVALVYKTKRGAEAATAKRVWHLPECDFYCRIYTKQNWEEALAASRAQGRGNLGRIKNPHSPAAFFGPQDYGRSTGNGVVGAGYNQNRQLQARFPNAEQQFGQGTTIGKHLFRRMGEYQPPAGLDSQRQSHSALLQLVAGRGGGGAGLYLGGAQGAATVSMSTLSPSMRGYQTAGFGSLNAWQQVGVGGIGGGGGNSPIGQGAPSPSSQYQRMGGYCRPPVYNSLYAQQQVAGSFGGGRRGGPIVRGALSPRSQYQHMGGYKPPEFNGPTDLRNGGRGGSGGYLGGRHFGQGAPTWSCPPWIGGYRPR